MRNLRDENRQLKEQLGRSYEFDNIVGRSKQMQDIFATILRVAPSRATVLLAGESGVGKDLIARAIHFHSPRSDQADGQDQLHLYPRESDGERALRLRERRIHRRATSPSPANSSRPNRHRVLDEIGDVPGVIQVKLLRVLQEREFERLGSNKTQRIDVRVIAATNQRPARVRSKREPSARIFITG